MVCLYKKSSLKILEKSEKAGAAILPYGDGLTAFFLPPTMSQEKLMIPDSK